MLLWWYHGTVRLSEGNTMVYTGNVRLPSYKKLSESVFLMDFFKNYVKWCQVNTFCHVFFWGKQKGQAAYIS